MAPQVPESLLPLLSLPPSTYIQSYFALLGAGVLTLQLLPALQDALLSYGPRNASLGPPWPSNPAVSLLRQTGLLIRVPHAWFSHFYVALLAFQFFWAAQYVTRGRILSVATEKEAGNGRGRGMVFEQVVLVWVMLTIQGARRLYECWAIMKPSASQMLGAHWVLSVLVYLGMSTAVWVEGSSSLLEADPSWESSVILTPRAVAAVGLFVVASYQQHKAHRHLASLRKYTLPHEGLFRYIVCPHYTCECLIYFAFAKASAPQDQLFNRTLLSGLFFVVANLGATAKNTKAWYADKFGAKRIPRWRMIPFVF